MARARIPNFRSEKEEAEWWDAHPKVITELFLKARKEGRIKRLPVARGSVVTGREHGTGNIGNTFAGSRIVTPRPKPPQK
jgi:hypothetical protein